MNEGTANQSLYVAFFILGDPFVGYECFYSSHVRKGSGGTPAEGARSGPSNWAFISVILITQESRIWGTAVSPRENAQKRFLPVPAAPW